MGKDSTPRLVVAGSEVGPKRGQLWRLTFDSQSRPPMRCNDQHILVLKLLTPPRCVQSESSETWSVSWDELHPGQDDEPAQRSLMPRERMQGGFLSLAAAEAFVESLQWKPLHFEVTVRDFRAAPVSQQRKCVMYQPGLIHFPAPAMPLHQRLVAALQQHAPEVTVTLELVQQTAWAIGVTLTQHSGSSAVVAQALQQWKVAVVCGDAVLPQLLHSYGLLLDSSAALSHALLTDAAEVRQSLLEGFLDGHDEAGYDAKARAYRIVCKDVAHVDSVVFLARSLGFVANGRGANDAECDSCVVTVSGSADELARLRPLQGGRCPHETGTASAADAHRVDSFTLAADDPSGKPGEFFGFELRGGSGGDGDGRCLLADFVVTHNSRQQASRSGGTANGSSSSSSGSTSSLVGRMWREEGATSFFNGMAAKMSQTVLNSAFMFLIYERLVAVFLRLLKFMRKEYKHLPAPAP